MSKQSSTSSHASPQASEATFAPIVAAIGSAAAVELFLKFGGSAVYVPDRPKPGSRLLEAIGAPAVAALRQEFGRGHIMVPLANAWIARQLAVEGVSRAEMCRLLRVSRTSLRGYLGNPPARRTGASPKRIPFGSSEPTRSRVVRAPLRESGVRL